MPKAKLDPSVVTLLLVFFSLIGAGSCVLTGRGDPQNFLILAGTCSGGYYGMLQANARGNLGDGN